VASFAVPWRHRWRPRLRLSRVVTNVHELHSHRNANAGIVVGIDLR
jgi:hypothetical protein